MRRPSANVALAALSARIRRMYQIKSTELPSVLPQQAAFDGQLESGSDVLTLPEQFIG
jgi:hypothetical protein